MRRRPAQARENGNPAAMVSATMGKARVNGLLVDKHLVGLKRLDEMNGEELRAFRLVSKVSRTKKLQTDSAPILDTGDL